MTRPAPVPVEFWSLPQSDSRALWWSISPEGHLGIVLVHQRFLYPPEESPGWTSPRPRLPFEASLLIVTEKGARQTPLPDLDFNPFELTLLAQDRFVVTGSLWTDPDRRGHPTAIEGSVGGAGRTVDPHGFGSDIPAAIGDTGGRLWTLHGDQGIFGFEPWSQPGLVGWHPDGRHFWTPQGRMPGVGNGISLATENDYVWALYHAGAPIHTARVTPATGDVISYPTEAHRYSGFAVRGTRALFSTRHRNDPTILTLTRARLWDGLWVETDHHNVKLPGAVHLHSHQGRDGVLWLRAGDTWLHVDV
ncbi:hypothetical protein [Kineosporia babensis]|uniref:Uncharacterized protein n=1 Tax=Kineosporia babensis TaxID=499548 RepID=A0A9X1T297_9ACTN|nr:hypothetical protein [Kineosporia babensis]MCD5314413.1 hypothetical protein [Kineosporia babensis]